MKLPLRVYAPESEQEPSSENDVPVTSCRRGEDLKAYIDGELSPVRRGLAAWHVRRCASCREEVTWLEQMSRTVRPLDTAVPRPELRARILASLPNTSPVQLTQAQRTVMTRTPAWTSRRPALALGSLCAMLLLMVGAFALSHWNRTGMSMAHVVGAPFLAQQPTTPLLTDPKSPIASVRALPSHSRQDPFAPHSVPEIASVVPSTGSDIPGNNPSSTTPAETSENTYTDATSLAAEQAFAKKWKEAEVERVTKARQMIALQKAEAVRKAVAARLARSKGTSPAPIEMAVADVTEAHKQLQQWAVASGARLTVVAIPAKSPLPVGVAGSSAPVGTMLELRVPSQRADSLKASLSRIGTPLPANGAGKSGLPVSIGALIQDAPNARVQHAIPDDASSGIAPTFVTVRVHLLPGELTPR